MWNLSFLNKEFLKNIELKEEFILWSAVHHLQMILENVVVALELLLLESNSYADLSGTQSCQICNVF